MLLYACICCPFSLRKGLSSLSGPIMFGVLLQKLLCRCLCAIMEKPQMWKLASNELKSTGGQVYYYS